MQNPLRLLYPHQCIVCGALVEEDHGLCGTCWVDTPFISGLTCTSCGCPLMGDADEVRSFCDDCMEDRPPWIEGRAVLIYRDTARRIILQLKRGDRLDLVRPAAKWMAARGAPLIDGETCLVPVPLHWSRLFSRRFNQSAALAQEIARLTGAMYCPEALVRTRRTRTQDDMTRAERVQNLDGAIEPNGRKAEMLNSRHIVIVDDVMTSGATLRAATLASEKAGAASISVLVLARVVKDT